MNTYKDAGSKKATLALVGLYGTRERAAELCTQFPDDLSDVDMILDTRHLSAASQGFIDEVCKQIAEIRKSKTLVIVGASESFRKKAETSSVLRGFSDRLSFAETI